MDVPDLNFCAFIYLIRNTDFVIGDLLYDRHDIGEPVALFFVKLAQDHSIILD